MTSPPGNGLVLGGGGVKVAYQAGVLEVLLERVDVSHVQATSSGVLNAALMSQGRNGPAIADTWRHTRPTRAMKPNWRQLPWLLWGKSLLTNDRLMKNVIGKDWRLSFPAPLSDRDKRTYSFNAYNFSQHALRSFDVDELNDVMFRACIALPRWFPPEELVLPDGTKEVWIDAVFATDTNAAALRLVRPKLDDIWVIWTVDISGQWTRGWRANYFRMLENSAAAAYRAERDLVVKSGYVPAKEALEMMDTTGTRPPHVLFEIAGDVPVHYLFTFFRRQLQRAVNQGVRDAKAYLERYDRLLSRP